MGPVCHFGKTADKRPSGVQVAGHGLGPRAHAQLGVKVLDVSVDGAVADAQARGDLLVEKALGQVVQDRDLARRQGPGAGPNTPTRAL